VSLRAALVPAPEAAFVVACCRRDDIDDRSTIRRERFNEAVEVITGGPATASIRTGIEARSREDWDAATIGAGGGEDASFEMALVFRHQMPSTCLKRSSHFFRRVHDEVARDSLSCAVLFAGQREGGWR
jgi:arginine/lysine/ornithine decarboxylase